MRVSEIRVNQIRVNQGLGVHYIMSSSTCFQHSPIIDPSTATIVCQNCARVIDEGLTHFEVNQQKYCIPQENLKDEKKVEKMNGENVIHLLEEISAKLHLNQSSIDIAYCKYKKNTEKIQKILNRPNKNSTIHLFYSLKMF